MCATNIIGRAPFNNKPINTFGWDNDWPNSKIRKLPPHDDFKSTAAMMRNHEGGLFNNNPPKNSDCQVIDVQNGRSKMEVFLDASNYKPGELSVSIADGEITIEGNHEERAEDGTKMVSRQFVRKYTLPAEAKPEDVVSNLSSDGVLVITAKKSLPAIDVQLQQTRRL